MITKDLVHFKISFKIVKLFGILPKTFWLNIFPWSVARLHRWKRTIEPIAEFNNSSRSRVPQLRFTKHTDTRWHTHLIEQTSSCCPLWKGVKIGGCRREIGRGFGNGGGIAVAQSDVVSVYDMWVARFVDFQIEATSQHSFSFTLP